MSDYGIVTEAGAVRVRAAAAGTDRADLGLPHGPGKAGHWLAAGPMELRIGGPVELNFHHADLSAEKTPPERYK